MGLEQIKHLERLVASKDIEISELKKKLYNASVIIREKNEMIEFYGDQLKECKKNYKAQKAIFDRDWETHWRYIASFKVRIFLYPY